ncbi:hypothetical protein [Oleisolibacter albus]|uniref:hypothetical protein n=1 Tax=Oleisolibacter albus TaxID=2171757 RepID=UPI0012D7ED32|nr:hypothetical protein [Oleisolibacter albus]
MKRLLAPALVGLIAGLDTLGAGIAFAALLFPAGLSAGLGMGVILLSGAVTALAIALQRACEQHRPGAGNRHRRPGRGHIPALKCARPAGS